ncbi:MAG: hypothetical protein KF726_22960 [Anaerolineae bacterium]|nr:hypothetical protein [Anaerolineae bacterium]
MDAEKLISLPEAARLIEVDASTLARAARLKKLRADKIGGVWLVTPSEARRWKQEDHNPKMKRR